MQSSFARGGARAGGRLIWLNVPRRDQHDSARDRLIGHIVMRPWMFLATAAMVLPIAASFAQTAGHKDASLREIMGELGGEYLRIADAILRDDYDQAAQSASAIAHHPMPETVVGAIKKALGSEFINFDEIDEASHAAALAVHDAAARHDDKAMSREAASLLSTCVECHSRFRARLRPLSD